MNKVKNIICSILAIFFLIMMATEFGKLRVKDRDTISITLERATEMRSVDEVKETLKIAQGKIGNLNNNDKESSKNLELIQKRIQELIDDLELKSRNGQGEGKITLTQADEIKSLYYYFQDNIYKDYPNRAVIFSFIYLIIFMIFIILLLGVEIYKKE